MASQTAKDLPTLLTARELAAQLDIHFTTVYRLARRGSLPCVRIGHAVRFDPEAVRDWLAAGGTAAEESEEA